MHIMYHAKKASSVCNAVKHKQKTCPNSNTSILISRKCIYTVINAAGDYEVYIYSKGVVGTQSFTNMERRCCVLILI